MLSTQPMMALNRAKQLVVRTNGRSVPTGADTEPIRVDGKLLLLLLFVAAGVAVVHSVWDAHFDFGIFYYAAHMVLAGARHALYDLSTQRAFQAQFHRPVGLFFCHPPVALIPFIGIAKLPIEAAFIIWTAASLGLLIFSLRTLAHHAGLRYGNWPILLSLAFMPVAECLGNGQLALLLLSAYVLAYSLCRQGRLFLGGVALAVVTLKFQLVVGFAAVLLLKRKWRELLGFTTGSALLVAISALITGVPGLLRYPVFLWQGGPNSGAELEKMANWRGLLSLGGAGHALVVVAVSVLTILFAARLWRDLDTGFSAAIIAAMLVSYHFNLNDLSLFLIPAFLSVRIGLPKERLPQFALSALLIPAILAIFGGCYALLAIPLGLCLLWMWQQERADSFTEIAITEVTQ